MNLKETVSLLYLAKNLYPRDKGLSADGEELINMAKAWAEMLRDIPFEVGKAAVAAHAAGSPFAPAISEIRDYARRLTQPREMTGEEGWAIAMKTIGKYGASPYKDFATGKYPFERARENTPPEVWQVMELLGYRSMCMSENREALRAQFLKTWDKLARQRREQEALLPFLPDELRDQFLAIGE